MSGTGTFSKIAAFKSPAEFRDHLNQLGIDLPCTDQVAPAPECELSKPASIVCNGKTLTLGNRLVIQPMEGWDGTTDGRPTEDTVRRWENFGRSGAKLIWGGEAMAVRADGRANPNQLIIDQEAVKPLADLRMALVRAHETECGSSEGLLIGFQLTHSGRFCKPHDKFKWEPRTAYPHPLLDEKFAIQPATAVLHDDEVARIIQAFIDAAHVAREAGADFVDIKHCHGYLLHEFLSAHNRPGPYGGSFENRTRILREIVQGIRDQGNPIGIGVRLSAFDTVPFAPRKDASQKTGTGEPVAYEHLLPYRFAFGCHPENPLEQDLSEPLRFLKLCDELGIRLINLSAGSPYYNPHLLRPAAYPPSDGYQPPHDPLIDVARQMHAARELKRQSPPSLFMVGSGYSYLQEFMPLVAEGALKQGWIDGIGMGRITLSYPRLLADAMAGKTVIRKKICRTFSDCTTAPRKGLPSGCYPLDPYYSAKKEAGMLKAAKQAE